MGERSVRGGSYGGGDGGGDSRVRNSKKLSGD